MIVTVPHIAVVLHVRDDDDLTRSVAFWTEACRIQMERDIAPAWDLKPPGVFFYGTAAAIPEQLAAVVGIFADAGQADAAGYHTASGDLIFGAVDLSRSSNPARTLSHEIAELTRNPWLDAWVPGPIPGREYAAELGDPVQRNTYKITTSILGEKEEVDVADFVLPAWFNPKLPGPKTFCGSVKEAFEIAPGGYQVAREGDNILYLPARGEAIGKATIERPFSRTRRISNGVTVQQRRLTS